MRHPFMSLTCVAATMLLALTSAAAEPQTRLPHTWAFELENDTFGGTDEGYTNGARLSSTGDIDDDMPRWSRLFLHGPFVCILSYAVPFYNLRIRQIHIDV